MDSLIQYFHSLDLDILVLLRTGCILLLGTLIISLFGRFVFGRNSVMNTAVSSAIGIVFIYAITVVCSSAGAEFASLVAPLPFASIAEQQLILFSFQAADYTAICSEITGMIILAFFVNLVDSWLPKGKGLIAWIFFRCLTVAVAFLMHLAIVWVFTTYFPEGIVTYAPTILLVLLVAMLLTGALKLLVGLFLSSVSPLIGAFYTFFFANAVGKLITRAVLTTTVLAGVVILLHYVGCGALGIAPEALIAYVPFVVALIAIWYLVNHKL